MPPQDLPGPVAEALARGRAAYLRQDFAGAEAADGEALTLARAHGSGWGMARATRLLGLCAYRRGHTEQSEALLREARRLAREIGCVGEDLLACNHLGATLRKLGKLEEADAVFREALERADPRTQLVARARLIGNYGAFLDDLGDRQAAAEHYARFEELVGLLDDPARLANARGLVSRAARMRGDLRTALRKAEEERDLGTRAGQPLRARRGWLHLAQVHAERGSMEEAQAAFLRAEEGLAGGGDVRIPVEVAVAHGQFLLARGHLHGAHAKVLEAQAALRGLSPREHEHRARVSRLAAEVAAAAGLHGEALWHLGDALASELERFEPISDPRLRAFTRHRRAELASLARRLLDEAGAVERASDEETRVMDLVRRLGPDAPPAPPTGGEPVGEWRARVHEQARLRWACLLPEAFPAMSPASRGDLLLADVVYQGPVGDLARSLFLFFVIVERELQDRVLEPLRSVTRKVTSRSSDLQRLLAGKGPGGLGTLVTALTEAPERFPPDDALVQFAARHPAAARLQGLRRLREAVRTVDDRRVRPPIDVRNGIAHGSLPPLARTDADAVRRVLTLGPEATLALVFELPRG